MKKLLLILGLFTTLILSGCGGHGYDGEYVKFSNGMPVSTYKIILEGNKLKFKNRSEMLELEFESVEVEGKPTGEEVTFVSELNEGGDISFFFDSETSFLFDGHIFEKVIHK